MKNICHAALLLFTVFGPSVSLAEPTSLPRATPESQGVSSAAIRSFVEAANEQVKSMHSVMLVRHGKVVAEGWWAPEAANKPHILWSLSKSFTSTAVGLAVAEGKLNIDDKVLKFFPEDAPADPSENLKAMRVRDLLTMSAGHAAEPWWSGDDVWTMRFLAEPVVHEPGSHFRYNTPATYMQSAIVQKVTGQTVVDYLTPRLFEPLGIDKPTWDKSPQGISIGGYGLYLKTEDIAKFGQLYLQKGQWNGKQLIPADWVALATSKQVENDKAPSAGNPDWRQGYGFQFWQCRHGAFRGDGKDGQFCIVLPKQDAVIAITALTGNMQKPGSTWSGSTCFPRFRTRLWLRTPPSTERLQTTLAGLKLPDHFYSRHLRTLAFRRLPTTRPTTGHFRASRAWRLLRAGGCGRTGMPASRPARIRTTTLPFRPAATTARPGGKCWSSIPTAPARSGHSTRNSGVLQRAGCLCSGLSRKATMARSPESGACTPTTPTTRRPHGASRDDSPTAS